MPSTIIHEEVGVYISKKINITSYDYYLGILAPDTPNLEGFAPKEERWQAHQREKDYDKWYEKSYNFYKNNKDNYNKDFIIGYYIHIITDIVYDELLYEEVKSEIKKKSEKEDPHDIMRNDMDNYYFNEIEKIKDVLESNNNSYDILNISKNKLIKFKIKCLNNFSKHNNSLFITEKVINKLNEEVYKKVKDVIEI